MLILTCPTCLVLIQPIIHNVKYITAFEGCECNKFKICGVVVIVLSYESAGLGLNQLVYRPPRYLFSLTSWSIHGHLEKLKVM